MGWNQKPMMRKFLTVYTALVSALILVQVSALNSTQPPQIEIRPSPLTSEQTAVYHAFFVDYRQGSSRGDTINAAELTETLQPDEGDYSGCMKGFRQDPPVKVIHRLTEDFANGNNLHLVDPKLHKVQDPADSMRNGLSVESAVESGFRSGLLTISEIIFDAKHKRAAFHYSFVCGQLCAHYETVVYEKRHGAWKRSKSSCGYGIS
jgi:hypothetical protein